ncbi:MAG: helix-turn-helix domain-containing protein [Nanoarchaeota archaeon]|nr:helix-turn-helix domain-containing protein [Nanoarchaeota archaeon]
MEILQKLKESGVPENQAKVYLELFKKGSTSANELSKKVGLDRTLTYQILNNLIEKGLVNYIIKENKKFFETADPDNLLRPIKEKEKITDDLIKELRSIKILQENEQEVKIYEGKKGLMTFFNDIIHSKNICIFGATGRSYDVLKFEVPHIAKEAQKLGIKGRMIISKEYKGHPTTKLSNLKVGYLEEVKSPATTTIYEDKVGIHVLSDQPIIIIIKNKDVADGYRSYFNFLWKIAKR